VAGQDQSADLGKTSPSLPSGLSVAGDILSIVGKSDLSSPSTCQWWVGQLSYEEINHFTFADPRDLCLSDSPCPGHIWAVNLREGQEAGAFIRRAVV